MRREFSYLAIMPNRIIIKLYCLASCGILMRTAFLILIGFQVTVILSKNLSIYYAYYAKNIVLALHFKHERGREKKRTEQIAHFKMH